jgi:hypothetical protein
MKIFMIDKTPTVAIMPVIDNEMAQPISSGILEYSP